MIAKKQKEWEPRQVEPRSAPFSMAAESVVLNEMLVEGSEKTLYGLDALKSGDFYLESNRRVFQAIEALVSEGEAVNLITVGERLKRSGDPVRLSTYSEAGIMGGIIEAANIVRDLARRRDLLVLMASLTESLYSGEDVEKITADAIGAILESASTGKTDPVPMAKAIKEALKNIEGAMAGETEVSERTGIRAVDKLTSGLFATDLVVVGGRPGFGKTAFAMTIALNLAKRGQRALFVNAEMPSTQLAVRSLAMSSGIPNFALRRGRFDESKIPGLLAEAGRICDYPLSFYIENDWQRIKAKIQAEKVKHPDLRLVVLDYVQRFRNINGGRERLQRYQELGRVADEAKSFALRLSSVTVMMLSQLNRSLDTEDRKPSLRDLRESGDIEAAADDVWFLHPDSGKDAEKDKVHLIVAKQRSGPTGEVPMRYIADEVRFDDWESSSSRSWSDSW